MNAELFYIARMKDDYICFLLAGPYFDAEFAFAELSSKYPQSKYTRTYNAVVKQVQEFEVVEDTGYGQE